MRSPASVVYYFSKRCYDRKLTRLSYAVNVLGRLLFSVWLPGSARIGKRLTVGYWGLGIVIHNKSIIGDDCWICQNVTIGRNFTDVGVPRVGNSVYIGAGSVLFGEIEIGDNVFIGSNCVVNKSVPPNCTVVGNPMRIISTDNPYNHVQLRAMDKNPAVEEARLERVAEQQPDVK